MIHSAADFAWRLLSALSYLAAGLGVLLVTLVIGLIIARRIYLLTLPSRRNHPQTELELQVLSDPLIDVKEEFVTIRGRTLFRRIYRHKSAAAAIARDPNAQPIVGVVVFMHGIGSDGVAALRKHVMTLLNHGLAVVSPDFYGHGRSDGVHEFFDPLELVEDLKTHVDQIKAMHMFRELPIFLFGLSIGGHVALRYARKYGSDLAGMTLLSPAVAVAKETVPPKIILYIALTLRWLFPELPLAKFNDSGWNDLAAQSKYKKYPLIYYGRLRIGTGLTIMYSVAELEKQLTEITTPFLVVHGRQDRVCAIEGSLMLYERAAAADKEIIIYEHCNHVLLWEPHGRDQRIMLDVTRWIRRRCAHADRVAHPAHCGCHLKSNVDRAGGGIISDEYEPSDSSPIPHSPSSTGSGSRSRSGSTSSSGACHHDACNTCSPALRRPQSAHPVLIAPVLTNRARNGNTSPSANSSSPLPNPTKMDSEMCACCAPLTCNSVAVCPPFADPPQSHDLTPAC